MCCVSNQDINKHGHINYTEFLAATLETQGLITTKSLTDAFDRLDSDDTGFISNEVSRFYNLEFLRKSIHKIHPCYLFDCDNRRI